jgi:hypothetical protein
MFEKGTVMKGESSTGNIKAMIETNRSRTGSRMQASNLQAFSVCFLR